VHLNPDDAVRAHQILKPGLSVGTHLGTFHLSDEGIDAPARQLEEAIKRHGVKPEDFIILDFGETVTVAD
jgi:L-ascorbate metabolism protein UlaG (beta-lactamase superfamily)